MAKRYVFSCSDCGTTIEGATAEEALEDARNTGWEERSIGRIDLGLLCPDCVLEERKL